jgi:hypothetical protein
MNTGVQNAHAVTASVHDDGLVLFNTHEGRLFTANHVGARIWDALQRAEPLDDIAARISREYQVPVETARADAARFVAELEQARLVAPGARP